MQQFLSAETLIIELLLIVSIVAITVRRLCNPYTIALVVVSESCSEELPHLSQAVKKPEKG
jgi:hypothetical protein